jgi:hypothetical protein
MTVQTQILALCSQGGLPEARLMAALGRELTRAGRGDLLIKMACLRNEDAAAIAGMTPQIDVLHSFEQFRAKCPKVCSADEAVELSRAYPMVNWWAIAASERSFMDASFLVGGLGQRRASQDYVLSLVVSLARYFEEIFDTSRISAVVCAVADTLITHVLYQVARSRSVRILGMTSNAWIRENGKPGFFIIRDEFLHSDLLDDRYREFRERAPTHEEMNRVQEFKRSVVAFDIKATFTATTSRPFIVPPTTPHLRRLPAYLRENAQRDPAVEYYKFDAFEKSIANVRRAYRRWRTKGLLGPKSADIPPRSIFYPMQYQPEQTTLVGGIFFANQIAVIENIAKALPFGYNLIVKEHPRGRGARAAWQYEHLTSYPNVRFFDGDSKEILQRCEAVVTITGTIGLEAMALDKPAVVLGQTYYDVADVIYRPSSWPDVARDLKRILIDREYDRNMKRRESINAFFLAYLNARVPHFLSEQAAPEVADAIYAELVRASRLPALRRCP